MHRHGIRLRRIRIAGEKKWCWVWRFRCPGCGRCFTRLPWFVLPFKQYVVGEVEGVVRHLFEGGRVLEAPCEADDRTLRRWGHEFSRKLPGWAAALESLVPGASGRVTSLIRYSHPLKRLEKALSSLPALPSDWTTMVRTFWWLWTSHPLCLPGPP